MGLSLSLSGIGKTYNGKHALNGCSAAFEPGTVSSLMGPNGSGKSTLLRICALLEPPDAGEVTYASHGTPLAHDKELKRRITLLLPRIGVFNDTVFNNAAYGLNIRNGEKRDIVDRVHKALTGVGLMHKKGHNALTLSSGETQRLGIARAMVIEPEILFLDEPTAAVDEENKEIIEDIIVSMKKENRTTFIIATHDREQAEKLADRIILMRSGTIVNREGG